MRLTILSDWFSFPDGDNFLEAGAGLRLGAETKAKRLAASYVAIGSPDGDGQSVVCSDHAELARVGRRPFGCMLAALSAADEAA